MATVMVSYRVKPDHVERNLASLRAVHAGIQAVRPEDRAGAWHGRQRVPDGCGDVPSG